MFKEITYNYFEVNLLSVKFVILLTSTNININMLMINFTPKSSPFLTPCQLQCHSAYSPFNPQ